MILWKYLHRPCSCPSSDARTERNALSSIRSATTGQTVTNPIRSYFNSHSKFCWQNYSTINHQFHPKLFLFSFQILAQLSKRSWNTAGPSVLTDLMRKTAVSAFLYLYHLEYRVSQKKVSDKIFPRRLPNGRGLRTNRKLCRRTPGRLPEVCLLLFWGNDQVFKDASQFQSHKNPVSASAMLTGKFLQIRKVFVTSSLLAEEYPDTLQYKISR